jgi:hypothetical protein
MGEQVRPDEAARALTEIKQRHEQVVQLMTVPVWFWWVPAGLMVMLSAATQSRRPVLIGIGFAVFVLGNLTLVGWVLYSRVVRRAQLRYNLMPRAGFFAIFGFVALALAVQLTTVFVSQAVNFPHEATIGSLPNVAVLVLGGPILTRYLHRIMRANTPTGRR